ncbi:MAG: hypothetical protein ABL874_04310 [Sphingopyxis sp.]
MRRIALCLALFVAGCDARQDDVAIDTGNPLDVAAAEAHLIVDPGTTPAVGLYERGGAAGVDGLCVAGEDEDELRFGVVMHFGATLVCEGTGSAVHDGDTLSLDFDGADCAVELAYDGRALRFPGTVPDGCAALCAERASLAGGAMNRVGWTSADALRLRSRRDVLQQRPPRALCM